MKDDYGRTWTRKDYFTGGFLLILILIAIPIPAGIIIGMSYIFGWNYFWEFWGAMMAILFAWNIWMIVKPRKPMR